MNHKGGLQPEICDSVKAGGCFERFIGYKESKEPRRSSSCDGLGQRGTNRENIRVGLNMQETHMKAQRLD